MTPTPTQNEQVEIARSLLARELRTRGAEVAFVTWDFTQGKGIDDLLANVGPEKVLELLEPPTSRNRQTMTTSAFTRLPMRSQADTGLPATPADDYTSSAAAATIRMAHHLSASKSKQLLERMRLSSKWTSHKAEEVVKYIEVDAPLLWERPPLDQVNVLNGLLDVNTRTLSPHSA